MSTKINNVVTDKGRSDKLQNLAVLVYQSRRTHIYVTGWQDGSYFLCIIGVETDKVRGLDLDSFSGRVLLD